MVVNSIEAAKAALPIFGGTTPAPPSTESPPATDHATEPPPAPSASDPGTAGGDSADPGSPMTPEQVSELLKQVGDLTSQVSRLTNENNTYKSKEHDQQRAQQTREQQLEQDLTDAQQTIAKMDAVIRHTAIINAIQGMKDMEFYSARHVMSELNMDSFDLDVDLDNGSATVTGIEGDLKRIAKECPWMVARDKTHVVTSPNGTPRVTRGSGAPPAPPGGVNDKATKRAELMSKYPVIAHGRTG